MAPDVARLPLAFDERRRRAQGGVSRPAAPPRRRSSASPGSATPSTSRSSSSPRPWPTRSPSTPALEVLEGPFPFPMDAGGRFVAGVGLGKVDNVIRARTNVIQSSNLDGLTILRKEDLDARGGHSYHRSYCDNDVRMVNSQRTRRTWYQGPVRIDRQGCRRSVGRRRQRIEVRIGSNEGRRQVADDRVGARDVSHQIDVHRVRGDSRFRAASPFAPPVPSGPRGKGAHVKVKAAVLREVTQGLQHRGAGTRAAEGRRGSRQVRATPATATATSAT